MIEKVEAAFMAFKIDATAQVSTGNRAAGTQARKASLEIKKAMKEFRKVSIEDVEEIKMNLSS
ncbi:MAG: histone H1 [Mucinivorans sp.]